MKKISPTETTVFVYDAGGQLVAEYSTQTAQTPRISYLTTDHLGSPRVVTDANGAVIDRKDYTAFGEVNYTAERTQGLGYDGSAEETRKGYTGYEKDDESGLDFAQARYYNSTHGRYTSVDPLTASASIRNPQTFNRYSYVLNSPYKFVDPLGLLSAQVTPSGNCDPPNSSCINSTSDKPSLDTPEVHEQQHADEGVAGENSSSAQSENEDGYRRSNIGVSGINIPSTAEPGSTVPIEVAVNTSPAIDANGDVVKGAADPLNGAQITILLTRLDGDPNIGFTRQEPLTTEVITESNLILQETAPEAGDPVIFTAYMQIPKNVEPSSIQIRAEIVSAKRDNQVLTAFTPNQNSAVVTVNPQTKDAKVTI